MTDHRDSKPEETPEPQQLGAPETTPENPQRPEPSTEPSQDQRRALIDADLKSARGSYTTAQQTAYDSAFTSLQSLADGAEARWASSAPLSASLRSST